MSEQITKDMFHHLAELAALRMDDKEAGYLYAQLNQQLKAVNELNVIPTDKSVQPASHGVPYPPEVRPALREDIWQPYENTAGILAQAPQTADQYFVVPDIPHTRLE